MGCGTTQIAAATTTALLQAGARPNSNKPHRRVSTAHNPVPAAARLTTRTLVSQLCTPRVHAPLPKPSHTHGHGAQSEAPYPDSGTATGGPGPREAHMHMKTDTTHMSPRPQVTPRPPRRLQVVHTPPYLPPHRRRHLQQRLCRPGAQHRHTHSVTHAVSHRQAAAGSHLGQAIVRGREQGWTTAPSAQPAAPTTTKHTAARDKKRPLNVALPRHAPAVKREPRAHHMDTTM